MIDSPSVPALPAPAPDQVGPEYRTIGTETVPLTGTTVVKFAQYLGRIPVYGSLVTIELDRDNSLLAVSSALGDPADVDPVATLSPAQARSVIRDHQGDPSSTDVPRSYFYFDAEVASPAWRLVYTQRDVLREPSDDGDRYEDAGLVAALELLDYVVDAHTGDLVATLPRTQTVTWTPAEETGTDALGSARPVRVERDDDGNRRLRDRVRNVRAHDFGFRDAAVDGVLLPGPLVAAPPEPWDGAAVSAHANAAEVAELLVTVLRRDGLDNRGGPSSRASTAPTPTRSPAAGSGATPRG